MIVAPSRDNPVRLLPQLLLLLRLMALATAALLATGEEAPWYLVPLRVQLLLQPQPPLLDQHRRRRTQPCRHQEQQQRWPEWLQWLLHQRLHLHQPPRRAQAQDRWHQQLPALLLVQRVRVATALPTLAVVMAALVLVLPSCEPLCPSSWQLDGSAVDLGEGMPRKRERLRLQLHRRTWNRLFLSPCHLEGWVEQQ